MNRCHFQSPHNEIRPPIVDNSRSLPEDPPPTKHGANAPPGGNAAPHFLPVACAIIENARGEILATRRPPDKALAGKWEFPGGKLHDGEAPRDALVREIREELGVTLTVGERLPHSEHDYGTFRIRLIPFRARIAAGDIDLREHTEARWLNPADLPHLDWAEADVPIVRQLVDQNYDP